MDDDWFIHQMLDKADRAHVGVLEQVCASALLAGWTISFRHDAEVGCIMGITHGAQHTDTQIEGEIFDAIVLKFEEVARTKGTPNAGESAGNYHFCMMNNDGSRFVDVCYVPGPVGSPVVLTLSATQLAYP